jgi:hypothetical protein
MDYKNYPFLTKFTSVINATELSQSSKDNYIYRLKKLIKLTGKDIDWVLSNCKKTLAIMDKNGIKEPQSVKALVSALIALFKHTKGLKQEIPKAHKCWLNAFIKVNDIVEKKYDNLEPSEKQVEAYIPWVDIIKRREELKKDSDDYLLLSLYTMIPPARADLNMIKIYRNQEPKESDKKSYPNFLLIKDVKGNDTKTKEKTEKSEKVEKSPNKSKITMTLVYNEFKSKSKNLQMYERSLPQNLIDVIEASLKQHSRDFLIVSKVNGLPYDKPNSYTKHFNRMLKNVFKNEKMSINTLRHSFVMSVDFNTLTPAEKELIAKDMMHSPDMFDRYRFNLPASKSTDGKQKICEVVCKDAN